MRVLDVGCGGGDTTALIAELVGPEGRVTGIDVQREAVEACRQRFHRAGAKNIDIVHSDANTFQAPGEFDAVAGRFVLMYAVDPVLTLRRLVRCLRAGGVAVLIEPDHSFVKPQQSAYGERVRNLIAQGLRGVGGDVSIGLKLFRIFQEAGLPCPELRCSVPAGGGDDFQGFHLVALLLNRLSGVLIRKGLAKEGELDLETVRERLCREVEAGNGVLLFPAMVSAWARKNEISAIA